MGGAQNVTPDEQGNYSVLLGTTKSEGLSLELFSSGEPRWLGVQLQLPGEVEQPRVLLVSVPYALKAADAETLGGQPLSSFVLNAAQATSGSGTSATSPTTPEAVTTPKTGSGRPAGGQWYGQHQRCPQVDGHRGHAGQLPDLRQRYQCRYWHDQPRRRPCT